MMFLFAIPLFEGLTIYLLPRCSARVTWRFPGSAPSASGATLRRLSPDLLSHRRDSAESAGSCIRPLSSTLGSPGINPDFWLLGITFVENLRHLGGCRDHRNSSPLPCAGMSLDKLPDLRLVHAGGAVIDPAGFPAADPGLRSCSSSSAPSGWPFFQVEAGGDSLLWQHLFWPLWPPRGLHHLLPARGGLHGPAGDGAHDAPRLGWVVAGGGIARRAELRALGCTTCMRRHPHMGLAFFSAASTLVAVPTGVQIFAWIGTIWKGRPEMHLPMLWILAFFATFVMGGPHRRHGGDGAVRLAVARHLLRRAHFHYVLVGGFVFPMLAGLYYWLPHFTGRKRYFKLGETAFWLIVLGFPRNLPAPALGRTSRNAAANRSCRRRAGVGTHQPPLRQSEASSWRSALRSC